MAVAVHRLWPESRPSAWVRYLMATSETPNSAPPARPRAAAPVRGAPVRRDREEGRADGGTDANDLPRQAEPLERADELSAEVELAGAYTVKRRGRKGVVVVVPRLAELASESQPTLVDSSSVSKRRPKTWQIEVVNVGW